MDRTNKVGVALVCPNECGCVLFCSMNGLNTKGSDVKAFVETKVLWCMCYHIVHMRTNFEAVVQYYAALHGIKFVKHDCKRLEFTWFVFEVTEMLWGIDSVGNASGSVDGKVFAPIKWHLN